MDVWYPVDPEDASGDPSLYQVTFQLSIIPEIWVIPLVFTAPSERALQDPLISQDGAFPLIVFSHGSGGLRYQSFFLTEVLASHGFVVAAAGHVGNTLLDELAGTDEGLSSSMMVARPLDVSFLITHMLERNDAPGDFFSGSIDGERIGVCGHSFGGFTSFAMAAGFGPIRLARWPPCCRRTSYPYPWTPGWTRSLPLRPPPPCLATPSWRRSACPP